MYKLSLPFRILFFTSMVLSLAGQVPADEEYNHFPSLAAPDLKTAVCNLSAYNKKLDAITTKSSLSTEDMLKVHELTYTLENALLQLQQDLKSMAADLEHVHKASERLDQKTIQDAGKNYRTAMAVLFASQKCQ
ncbi:DUF6746 family protein [Agaribacter flavus]|uniref:DUF6746 family protein n=1 Tax=Agaribacter flavus TaxID=1902781 RepID=A0ABV7FN06_9ALTE